MAARGLVVAMACLLAACSPFGGGAYACMNDGECGANGKCEPNNTCAFPDTTCDSGYRYGQYSQPSGECVTGGTGSDAGVDVPDGPPGEFCYGTGFVRPCFAAEPSGAQTIAADTTINTDDTAMCMATTNSSAWCVIAGATIDVNMTFTLKARGMRPLVLVATQSITIAGTLDVSSQLGDMPGAGADATGCNPGTAPGTSGGGAGGSFGGKGGDSQGVAGGGTAGAKLTPSALRGGCPGQNGNGSSPGTGGHGGGAVYMIATTSIFVSGTINASGEGGTPGVTGTSGGGGGGAGGYIGLECPSVTSTGVIFANGGGGGEGSGLTTMGATGADPDPLTPSAPAAGGNGNSTIGGDGGIGAASVTLGGGASAATCPGATQCSSGGGGGGGAGIIHLVPNNPPGGQVSPPQS
jgi:hypothetical protein